MKIYTKKGDKGKTSLIGGTRVTKSHLRIDAYGTVDELNSYLGLIRVQKNADDTVRKMLTGIQNNLFTIGSSLATDPGKSKMWIPDLREEDIKSMEAAIDKMNEELPELKNFILPGGNTTTSYCHVARCICRRAERKAVQLEETAQLPELVIQYLNRLSDYLFVLARYISIKTGGEETPWTPRENKP